MATQKVICDTDVLIEFFDENKNRHSETAATIEKIGINNMLISAISKMELIKGTRHKEHSQQVAKKLKRLDTILLSPEITIRTIELLNTYHLSHGLAIPDALIAATSLETGLKLFTYNVRDFKFIKGLNLYNTK
ncbi:type II toxin-antitoxin system VapC family toxin [Sphingobacterium sp. DN00404]|uniref:Ribonuclease VapC n=1 Tax=Sphingobacterium micropteri TaxID=2763501 RepID=A0ABR7YMH4_9SPHI|nr:type II toxin-antitoxin system VapC family toxin [Sphingobacterium micropteri]MBD1432524.1 type II toxin-antitoxin system VapC family toxin [Sphingobacterium micropteri]